MKEGVNLPWPVNPKPLNDKHALHCFVVVVLAISIVQGSLSGEGLSFRETLPMVSGNCMGLCRALAIRPYCRSSSASFRGSPVRLRQ